MQLTSTEKLDVANIGLMIISCIAAMIIPFELFLFVYAILGPLHYLTEISWLHDHNYYTKQRYDVIILVIVGLLITLRFFGNYLDLEFPDRFDGNLGYIALLCSLVFVTVQNKFYRIAGIVLIIFTSQLSHSDNIYLFLSVFLPTLVHVYLFTGLFMLYGAIKSKSRIGKWSVLALVLCPIVLYTVFPNSTFFNATEQSRSIMSFFKVVNIAWLQNFHGIPKQPTMESWDNIIFNTKDGILIMRFIAFAYTYHYLNWFSKTKIIQWHKVPKSRFIGVIVLWIISVALYLKDFSMGVQWLVFLSFLHVLLEFPLNVTSILGIGNFFKSKLIKVPQQ